MSEQWWVIYTIATGEAYSIGQVNPAVYPEQFSSVSITDDEAASILNGTSTWSKDLLKVIERQIEVPEQVTPWQFFTWLWRNKGITETNIRSMLATLPEPQRVQAEIDIDRADSFHRAHPLLTHFGKMIGMSVEEIDKAFVEMSRLVGTQTRE